jgi:Holliday junction DNA helicase RuvA
MIAQLTGIIVEKVPPEIVLDVGGVGYEIQLPMTSFYQLPEINKQVVLFTHFVVREDAQLLFGFVDRSERSLFRVLIKANGVGPKLACTILSGMSANQFVNAVLHEDITALVKMPGVGKKTAERLVVELKDKVSTLDVLPQSNINKGLGISGSDDSSLLAPVTSAVDEAISALIALGYKRSQAETAVKKIATQDASSEKLIRDSLKSMV